MQVVPDDPPEPEQSKLETDVTTESNAVDRPALPVRVRHHGLHQGIVSRPGIHGLEEQLTDEIDNVDKPCQQSKAHAGAQECARQPLTSAELWSLCCARVHDWSYWYTTYYHFRSKVSSSARLLRNCCMWPDWY